MTVSSQNALRAPVRIEEVVHVQRFDRVEGALESPSSGSESGSYSIQIEGWAVGIEHPVRAIEITADRGDLLTIPVHLERQDLAKAFEQPWAGSSGFRSNIGALHLPRRFKLYLNARLADGSLAELAQINGRRQPLPQLPAESIQPLLVTTVGRTGSTWLTWMLAQHPELLSYEPWEYEPRIGIYFTEMLLALSQPSSYLQMVSGDVYGPEWWLGRNRVFQDFEHVPDFERWLGSSYLEDLTRTLMGRVEAIYGRIAELEEKPGAALFVEKHHPSSFIQEMVWDIYPGAREIFLVRDPRDLLASVLAFGERRGVPSFGRELVESDEDYVRGPLRDVLTQLLNSWARRSSDAILLRYEDLICKPAETVEGLLTYLGVNRSPQAIEEMLSSSEAGGENQEGHRTAASVEASIGRWRTDLSPELQKACQEALGDLITAFGYTP